MHATVSKVNQRERLHAQKLTQALARPPVTRLRDMKGYRHSTRPSVASLLCSLGLELGVAGVAGVGNGIANVLDARH
eukprot:3933277-Rhodomonas_salina.1